MDEFDEVLHRQDEHIDRAGRSVTAVLSPATGRETGRCRAVAGA
jgi:hypothetical protein